MPWSELSKGELLLACPYLAALGGADGLGREWPFFSTTDEALDFFSSHESRAFTENGSSPAGGFGLRFDEGKAWFYYFLLPTHQHRGLSKLALRAVKHWTGQQHPDKTLWARCTATNVASLKALLSEGFKVASTSEIGVLLLHLEPALESVQNKV